MILGKRPCKVIKRKALRQAWTITSVNPYEEDRAGVICPFCQFLPPGEQIFREILLQVLPQTQ
ncbi:MAG: hypothetical protein M0Q13_08205 [Methanothrix sp.]|jgi:hypothetical protein|nr:hypothetical protein [Methanothrix sp.]